MTEQEQIDALKAQVNRFKHGVESFNKTGNMNELLSAYIETPKQYLDEHDAKIRMQLDCALKLLDEISGFIDTPEAHWEYCKELKKLKEKPEKCLAKEQARAIESVREQIGLLQRYSFLALHQYPSVTKMPDQSGRWIDRNEVDDLIEKHISLLRRQSR